LFIKSLTVINVDVGGLIDDGAAFDDVGAAFDDVGATGAPIILFVVGFVETTLT
jgi:hypothetical protein